MLILLLISQIICIIIFSLLIFIKNKVSYFGLSILLLQFITLIYIILFRIFSHGISFFFFLYVIFVPAVLPNILQFFSNEKETKIKSFIQDFNTKLDQNFFNLTAFNHISFYLSRKLFKIIFVFIQKKLYNFNFFFWLLFFPYIILVSTVVVDILVYNKIYFSPILLSIFFFWYRFLLLILRTNEYFSMEGLNYLKITFRKKNFQEPVIFFQETSNFLDIAPEDKNSLSLKDHWYIFFSGISYSSSFILSKNLRTIVLPLFFNFFLWILFFFSLALICFNFYEEFPIFLIFSILIVTIPLSSLVYVMICCLREDSDISDVKFFRLLVLKQKLLLENLTIFRSNFFYLELEQNLIIPKNRKPLNIIDCLIPIMILIDPKTKSSNSLVKFYLIFLLFCFCFSYFFFDYQSLDFFFLTFSESYLFFNKIYLMIFLIFNSF